MSIHKSLKISSQYAGSRNVLSRDERLVALRSDGRWTEEKGPFGLPKVRTYVIKKRAKKKKEEVAVEATAEAAAPAAEKDAKKDAKMGAKKDAKKGGKK